jgi:hypothetical protein
MKFISFKVAAPVVALGFLLAGCGGGSGDPSPTPIAASLTVSAATSPNFNGVYTTSAISLADVVKNKRLDNEPETCAFKFSGPIKSDGMTVGGDIRYIPANYAMNVVFITINDSVNSFEFQSHQAVNAFVDLANNQVVFTGYTLTSSTGVASTIILTGSVPMIGNRPNGC